MLLRQKNVIGNPNKSSLSQQSACQTMDPHWCRLVQPLQHQTDCSDRYFREYEGIFRIIFYHCQSKSGLTISFGVGIPVKLASVDRVVSYLVNLNWLQDLKFDKVCDNGVSQTIVLYMKFPKEVLVVVGWGMGPIYPNFAPAQQQLHMHIYIFFGNLVCGLHHSHKKQIVWKHGSS